MTFGVDPDTHIDSLEQAELATVEGTSKWSCKLTITGTHKNKQKIFVWTNTVCQLILCKFITTERYFFMFCFHNTISECNANLFKANKLQKSTHKLKKIQTLCCLLIL